MRLLGIDYGTKRVEVAIGDSEGRVAVPLEVIEIKNVKFKMQNVVEEVCNIAQREKVELVIMGQGGRGRMEKKVRELVKVTERVLKIGIKQVRAGRKVSHISKAIEKYVDKSGFGIVRDLVGHGVGYKVHEPPEIPNFWTEGFPDCVLQEGMVIAIEPMINLKSWQVKVAPDQWTILTVDGSPSAHFEHTVIVRKRRGEVVT